MTSSSSQATKTTNPQAGSPGKGPSPLKVDLSSNVDTVAASGKAVLTFTFSGDPLGFTLDDIKVMNGTVTNLVQSKTNPFVFTADFIGAQNSASNMSTIKLDGAYADAAGTLGTPSNTVTLKNVASTLMPTVGFTSNNAAMTEGNSGTTAFNFTAKLSASSTEAVTVYYTTEQRSYGTAKANADYIPVTGSVVFAPGETSKTISVNVIGDKIYEGNENFYLDLTSAKGATIVTNGAEGLRNSWVSATIKNDDVAPMPTVGFKSNNAAMTEGNSGTTAFKFTATLSASSTEAVTVYYTTEQRSYGTAKANADYIPVTGSVVFAPGETSKTISVDVIGDQVYEGNENFYLDLTSAKGANIVINGAEGLRNSWVSATIKNDDVAPMPTVGFKSNNAAMTEGNSGTTAFNFTAQLSASSTEAVTVFYTTEQKTFGTAKANADYVPVTGSVVFAPGETVKTISVNVIGDKVHEAKEYFYLDLTSAKGASIVINGAEGLRNSWVAGYINNDDQSGIISTSGIFGTLNKDVIGGTAHADLIDGKGAADILTGYAGNDTFVFASSYASKTLEGASQVTDFNDGFDLIGLRDDLTFSQITSAQGTGVHAADTVISLASGEVLVTLVGVNAASINASDFINIA